MKILPVFCLALLLLVACKKSRVSAPASVVARDVTDLFIGSFTVTEEATPAGFIPNDTFPGQVVRDITSGPLQTGYNPTNPRDSLNVIAFLQTGRYPLPAYVPSDRFVFKVFPTDGAIETFGFGGYPYTGTIYSKFAFDIGYTYSKDFSFYEITQHWTRN